MYGIGAQLRAERLKRNFSLDDIARETRISSRYLQALEAEDYERLPGLVFTRNFVRQFAVALQMDPAPLVERLPKLDESMVQLPVPLATARVRPLGGWPSPALTSAVWLLMAGGAGMAAYYYFNGFPRLRIEVLPAREATAQAASKAPAVSPPPAAADPVPQSAPEPVAAQTASPDTVPPAPAAAGTSDRAVEVVVTARAASWVQITADGKAAWTGTLQPSQTKTISADDQVRLLTGNAGGLVISLNGKTLDPLGPAGQVRSVRLTADGPELAPAPRSVVLRDDAL